MFGVGMSLTLTSFRSIFLYPKAITIGLVAQMILLPLLAFWIADASQLSPEFKVGLIILAACPGGASAGLLNHLLRGNVALSISLTSVNSIITLVTIPLITNLALYRYMGETVTIELPVLKTVKEVALMTLVPALIGVTVRRYRKNWALVAEKPLRYIMPSLLAIAFLGIIFFEQKGQNDVASEFVSLILPNLWLNLGGMLGGYLLGILFRLGPTSRMTISIEVGLQNSSLAIYVSSVLLGSAHMALVPVVYGSFTFITAVLFGMGVYRLNRWVRRLLKSKA
jgi:BASS family bile acid:Na+ symporter